MWALAAAAAAAGAQFVGAEPAAVRCAYAPPPASLADLLGAGGDGSVGEVRPTARSS